MVKSYAIFFDFLFEVLMLFIRHCVVNLLLLIIFAALIHLFLLSFGPDKYIIYTDVIVNKNSFVGWERNIYFPFEFFSSPIVISTDFDLQTIKPAPENIKVDLEFQTDSTFFEMNLGWILYVFTLSYFIHFRTYSSVKYRKAQLLNTTESWRDFIAYLDSSILRNKLNYKKLSKAKSKLSALLYNDHLVFNSIEDGFHRAERNSIAIEIINYLLRNNIHNVHITSEIAHSIIRDNHIINGKSSSGMGFVLDFNKSNVEQVPFDHEVFNDNVAKYIQKSIERFIGTGYFTFTTEPRDNKNNSAASIQVSYHLSADGISFTDKDIPLKDDSNGVEQGYAYTPNGMYYYASTPSNQSLSRTGFHIPSLDATITLSSNVDGDQDYNLTIQPRHIDDNLFSNYGLNTKELIKSALIEEIIPYTILNMAADMGLSLLGANSEEITRNGILMVDPRYVKSGKSGIRVLDRQRRLYRESIASILSKEDLNKGRYFLANKQTTDHIVGSIFIASGSEIPAEWLIDEISTIHNNLSLTTEGASNEA